MGLAWEISEGCLVIRLLGFDPDGEGRDFIESEIHIPLSALKPTESEAL